MTDLMTDPIAQVSIAQAAPAPRHLPLFALLHARAATRAASDPHRIPAPDPRRPLTEAERAALGYAPSFGR